MFRKKWPDKPDGADGTFTDGLSIDRKHNGNASPYWWYKRKNQVYLQAFVAGGQLAHE